MAAGGDGASGKHHLTRPAVWETEFLLPTLPIGFGTGTPRACQRPTTQSASRTQVWLALLESTFIYLECKKKKKESNKWTYKKKRNSIGKQQKATCKHSEEPAGLCLIMFTGCSPHSQCLSTSLFIILLTITHSHTHTHFTCMCVSHGRDGSKCRVLAGFAWVW